MIVNIFNTYNYRFEFVGEKKLLFFLIILLHLNLFSQTTYNITDPEAIEDLVLTAGDTVILADGTYSGDSTLDIYAEGTLSQPITFRPQTPGGVLFTGTMLSLIHI